ncbi:MAG TPA: RteC domain-containing protein, partial [Puia sp.]
MKSYTENLHNEILFKLDELDRNYNPQVLVDARLGIIADMIDQIKEELKSHQFTCKEDEVYYFKYILPSTLALYIYYSDKIQWDRIIRQGSPECQYKFIDRIYSQAETFRKDNHSFYVYYRDGKTELDNFYFLRNSPVNRETEYPVSRIIDPSSPPLHCGMLAMLIAYTRLEQELKLSISYNSEKSAPNVPEEDVLQWTGTKAGATELIYGLKRSGFINNGNVSLKRIKIWFEKTFNIDLGNTSKQFQELQRRKMSTGSIFDKLKEAFNKAIEEIEQEWLRKKRPPSGSPG